MKRLFLLILFAAGLWAADATGTWSGSLIVTAADGTDQSRPAHLVLKQDGTRLTGTAGPNAEEQNPIANGKVENDTLMFDVTRDEATMRFVLKIDGDHLTGVVTRERDGQTQTAKLDVKRVK